MTFAEDLCYIHAKHNFDQSIQQTRSRRAPTRRPKCPQFERSGELSSQLSGEAMGELSESSARRAVTTGLFDTDPVDPKTEPNAVVKHELKSSEAAPAEQRKSVKRAKDTRQAGHMYSLLTISTAIVIMTVYLLKQDSKESFTNLYDNRLARGMPVMSMLKTLNRQR